MFLKLVKRNFGILIVLALVAMAYLPVFSGFFEQDEWPTFAVYYTNSDNYLQILSAFFKLGVGHYTPLHNIFYYNQFLLFELNYTWHALVSVLLQLISVYLVFLLGFKLSRRRDISTLIAGVFGLNASVHQATSWMGATVNTHGATIFGLLSLLLLFKFIDSGKNHHYFLALVFVIVSLLFKEITLALFLVNPLVLYMFPEKKVLNRWRWSVMSVLLGVGYLIVRLLMLSAKPVNIEDEIVTETQNFGDLLWNVLTFPTKIFSQSVFPTDFLLSGARLLAKRLPSGLSGIEGTTAFDVFSQTYVLQLINWSVFVGGVALVYVAYRYKVQNWKAVLFGILFTLLNSFVYVLSPGRGGDIPVVDSRNLYFPSVGVAIFLGVVVFNVIQRKKRLGYLLVIFMLGLNLYWLDKKLDSLSSQGNMSRRILEQIATDYPDLPDKVVFYTESDTAYYGLPESEKVLPFQVNFGYILLVRYMPVENYSYDFVEFGGYLYGITDQGYKESAGQGFGYFRDFELLRDSVEKNNLPKGSVIAYRYEAEGGKLQDISKEVGNDLFD